jgi:tetratricopeptide (TPR) repeat protein
LVNTAALLAQQGRRILLVDFDLEAPGLDSFSDLGIALGRKGVVEYFSEFRETAKAPELSEYVQQSKLELIEPGALWVMASGRKDREYNRQRDQLNWSELYDIGFGQLMIGEWKAAISEIYQPDYVFVDSRTGLTDVGGVCTLHLPDLVITLFALNKQNVDGVASVINAIERAETKRRPKLLTVATPIPTADDRAVLEAVSQAQATLNRKIDLRISYSPAAALSERIFVHKQQELRRLFISEYSDIVERIKAANTEGLDGLLKQAQLARRTDNEPLASSLAEKLRADFGDRADAVLEVAEIYRRFGGREQAVPMWERALALDNKMIAAFEPLINFYKAERNYSRVVQLCRDFRADRQIATSDAAVGALSSEAEALMALKLFDEAVEAYKRLLDNGRTGLETKFNAAEAIRRVTHKPNPELWPSIIALYESGGRIYSAKSEANIAQAIHIPYACVGNLTSARDVLHKAAEIARPISEAIFSVLTYEFVSKDQFLEDNERCLAALDDGRLWDGMLLTESDPVSPLPS